MCSFQNDFKGQLPIEFLMILGFSIMILFPLAINIKDSSELNQAMSSARAGALEGSLSDGFAIYPDKTFDDYAFEHQRLLNPSSVKIINIDYINQGFNPTYQKTKIQLRIHASSSSVKDKTDRNCLGDRINYYVRKKICETFRTENLTNSVFNPAFSSKYVFTTADVYWD
ncbi:MAG: hypothetical protein HVN35_08485 [Methanobacteriaceae archaeon]|nr:hypothetical protein [Methanobacteriaceae archaeon]